MDKLFPETQALKTGPLTEQLVIRRTVRDHFLQLAQADHTHRFSLPGTLSELLTVDQVLGCARLMHNPCRDVWPLQDEDDIRISDRTFFSIARIAAGNWKTIPVPRAAGVKLKKN